MEPSEPRAGRSADSECGEGLPSVSLAFALFSPSGLRPSEFGQFAALAEQRGYDSVMVTETHADIFPYAAACAQATHRVTIGTAIANMGLRHPALMGLSAAAIDELAGGRFILGIGIGTQWFTREGPGAAGERPLRAVREYVELMRALWAGASSYQGELYELHDFPMDFAPPRRSLQIYLAALGERMCRLAGRIADGVFLGNLIPLDQVPRVVQQVVEGARRAGRDPAAVTVASIVRICLDDDLERAREAARATIPRYLGFEGYARYLESIGYGSVVAEGQAALARGDAAAALRAVPDELVQRTQVFGDAARCRARVEEYRRAGIELPVISGRQIPGVSWRELMQRTLDAFAPR
jgi:5,10-methylenetetrahydromethanopterin reductase